MPEISVIIPVYNVELYLKKCIESVLSQQFTDFEMILVDDGSNDRSGLICDEYGLKDPRIKTIHKENGGVSSARNLGLSIAKGKYLTFLDSDDYYDSNWLSDLYANITVNDADICVGNYKAIDNNMQIIHVTEHESGMYGITNKEEAVHYLLTIVLSLKHGWEVWSRLFKTELIEKNSIRFCESCNGYAEDMSFVLTSSLCAKTIISIDSNGYNYRKHESSMMARSKNVYKFNEINEVSHFFANFYINKYGNNEKVLAVIHFFIMYSEYRKIIGSSEYANIKKQLNKIKGKKYWRKQTKHIFFCTKTLLKYTDFYHMLRVLLLSHYCLHGNWARFRIESGLFYKFIKPKEKK